MDTWILLLIAATVGSVVSLAGGLYLLYGKKGVATLQRYAVPFAAGALLAAAFMDLLPESLASGSARNVLLVALGGILFFFILERSLSWFHHHHQEDGDETLHKGRRNASLIVIGDTIHNFIDGLAIGAAFLVSPATGIVTTLAIAAHEIPQEIGDFGLLIAKGVKKTKILLINVVSALATIFGAILVFASGSALPIPEWLLLSVAAGFFIYIATSDIIPTIHAEKNKKTAAIQVLVLLAGVVFVGATTQFAHSFIDHGHNNHESHEHHEFEEEHDHDH